MSFISSARSLKRFWFSGSLFFRDLKKEKTAKPTTRPKIKKIRLFIPVFYQKHEGPARFAGPFG